MQESNEAVMEAIYCLMSEVIFVWTIKCLCIEWKPLGEIVLDFSSLDMFFQMCRQENIKVICFYSPVYSSFCNQSEISSRTLISNHIRNLDIPFLDYSEREENSDSSYFKDSLHLNCKGAAWFTRLLAHDVATVLEIR